MEKNDLHSGEWWDGKNDLHSGEWWEWDGKNGLQSGEWWDGKNGLHSGELWDGKEKFREASYSHIGWDRKFTL